MGNDIKLLDCTLRDGGYVNDWKWGFLRARGIIHSLVRARVDVVEVGFLRNEKGYNADITVCSRIEELNRLLPDERGQTMFSAMAMRSNYDVSKLSPYNGSGIEMIRVTAHDYDLREGLDFARAVKEKGYKLSINPINIMGYSDNQILWIIDRVNEIQPYQFSVVDTFGSMKLQDMNRIVSLVDNNLDRGIRVALHLHENMSLSTSLAQNFINMRLKRPTAVDASLMGMGRIPGNLPIELIADYLNERTGANYDIDNILETIEEYVTPLKGKSNWGYTPAYFISARFNLHRNYVEHYLSKGDLTVQDINHILARISPQKKTVFDAAYADFLYDEYNNHKIDDSTSREALRDYLNGRSILVLAPGSSIVTYVDRIREYIAGQNPVVISVNFVPDMIPVNLSFFGNNKRLSGIIGIMKCKTIITSNLVYDRAEYVIDYNSLCGAFPQGCNSLIMLLKLLKDMSVKDIVVAGADGYSVSGNNYYDASIRSHVTHSIKFNDEVVEAISRLDLSISFLTPTVYDRGEHYGLDFVKTQKKYKAVLFDLDGTLLDTTEGVLAAVRKTISDHGYPMPDADVLITFVGPPMQKSMTEVFGLAPETALRVANEFRENYKASLFQAKLYDGVHELLESLQRSGIKIAVATNKSHENAMEILEQFGIMEYCDCAQGSDLGGKLSKKDIIEKCIQALDCDKGETVLVGDSIFDSQGAEQAGIDFIGVTYGFGFTEETVAEFPLARNCREIGDFLLGD